VAEPLSGQELFARTPVPCESQSSVLWHSPVTLSLRGLAARAAAALQRATSQPNGARPVEVAELLSRRAAVLTLGALQAAAGR